MNPSTKSDSADEGWHMVIAPHSAERSSAQHHRLDGDFSRSLPRAHFLPPGCFHAAAERGAFSPDSRDLCFKGEWMQDQCWWERSARDPLPLSQPGFYSPQITRARQCQSENTHRDYSAHTLPSPHTKLAVFKQSALPSRPQGIKTSVVEKPLLMRAAISPTFSDKNPMNPIRLQTDDTAFQHLKDHKAQTQCVSSVHQCSLNLSSTAISKNKEHLCTRCDHARSTKRFISVKKWARDPHVFDNSFPQSPSSPDHRNLHRDSKISGYCKLSVYNSACYSTQNNDKHNTSDAGNDPVSNGNKRQVERKTQNVFGQPCVMATLRSSSTAAPPHNTTVVEDLKKLILMDEGSDSRTQPSRSSTECHQHSSSPKTLMLCNPVCTRRPAPAPSQHFLQSSDPNLCQPRSGLSNTLVMDLGVGFDQDPLHLMNSACTLDWNRLVNAAETYETQGGTDLLAGESGDMQPGRSSEAHSPHLPHALSEAPEDNVVINFRDPLSHLETMLMRLSTDLLKEKKDKVALLAEVLKLRMSNEHLKEESLSANAQLHRICQMFDINPETVQ